MTVRALALLPFVLAVAACGGGTPTYITATAQPPERSITVSGTARAELTPDEACIELTLAARDASMPAAHARLASGMTALLAELRADHDLRVEQGAVRYSPDYESDGSGHTRLIGHVATAQVNVRVRDFQKIPDVVGKAAPHGLDRVDVVFYATDLVSRKEEVRRHALEAAHAKADAMAGTLGVHLGAVQTIHEGEASTNVNISVANYVAAASTDALPDQPPVPGSIPLTISVGVVYGLE